MRRLDELWQDLRYAVRALRASPGFTLAAVLSLALGIGVNTSIFSFINAILLRPLPVPHSEQLVSVYHERPGAGLSSSSYPDFEFYRRHNDVFSEMLAYLRVPMMLRTAGAAERVPGELTSGGYFQTLGLRPVLGRFYTAQEAEPVAVLSCDAWRNRFGGDPGVAGRSVSIGGHAFTIIGVAPCNFRGLVMDWLEPPDLWVPATAYKLAVPAFAELDVLNMWGMQSFLVAGRLKPGVSFEQAQAALAVLSARAAPLRRQAFRERWQFNAILFPAQQARFWPAHRGSILRFLATLAGAVGLVLLIACFNVANLLLARGSKRRREIAVRLSLGAGRARLVRQLLTESLLLAALGGAAGLVVAHWSSAYLASFHRPFRIPLALDTGFDGRVLAFAFLATLIAGVLFGVLPAFRAVRVDLAPALKSDSAGAGSSSRDGLPRDVLVAAQVAVSLLLLLGAGLFVRTLHNASAADVTVDAGNVLLAGLDLASQRYDDARATVFYTQLIERIRALPGVERAALVFIVPLSGMRGGTDIVAGAPGAERAQVDYNVVSPGYFETVGLPLLGGREFTDRDRAGAPPVAVVNEEMARRFWPGENAIGRRFRLLGRGESVVEIAGLVRDGKFRNVRDPVKPCFYAPLAQHPRKTMNLEVRCGGEAARCVAAIRQVVRSLDPEVPLTEVRTLKTHRDNSLSQERLTATLLGALGALALALAAIGIYGVTSFAVARRTREIGLRIALGARAGDVVTLVLRRVLWLALAGIGAGLIAALFLARLVAGLLYGVAATDPPTFLGTSLLLAAAAGLAGYLPARRAAKIDPILALRCE